MMWDSRITGDSDRQAAKTHTFREGYTEGVISQLGVER